jgi:hypothetical protein
MDDRGSLHSRLEDDIEDPERWSRTFWLSLPSLKSRWLLSRPEHAAPKSHAGNGRLA